MIPGQNEYSSVVILLFKTNSQLLFKKNCNMILPETARSVRSLILTECNLWPLFGDSFRCIALKSTRNHDPKPIS